MKKAAKEAALHYMTTKVFYFDDPESAGRFLQTVMKYGDLVLIKGSQGMRMEKAAEEIVADQQRLIGLLCRQSADWKKKLYSKP
jgi:UDP-N-acetylmuramoyl-tripeptide--D-alanyl-D-alanine ligase